MSEWQKIETAPKDKVIAAAIWHGLEYFIIRAKWMKSAKAWVDVNPYSCVGWTEGVSKPAYWFDLPPLPSPPTDGEG